MTKRQIQDYLQDILDAVAAIEQFTTGIESEMLNDGIFLQKKAPKLVNWEPENQYL